MDDIVKQAIAKWPNVPYCYGWLGLDARGDWCLRDAEAQALGSFCSQVPGAKGWPLRHEKLIAFIARNYEADEAGQWYFQNGPQRVYVELEVAPWVWRVQADFSVWSHTERKAHVEQAFLDETGRVFLLTELGFGLVHTQDVLLVSEAVEQGRWQLEDLQSAQMPARFGYVLSPELTHDGAANV